MNYKNIIIILLSIFIGYISLCVIKKPFYIVILLGYFLMAIFIDKINKLKNEKIIKNQKVNNFHKYLKKVILLTYTRPLKMAFNDAKVSCDDVLKREIDEFIIGLRYDFSIKPYEKLAFKINPDKNGINYEINIMYLLYEYEKKGLGGEFINDILLEIDNLIDNKRELAIEKLKESAYQYTLPPTILNFFYVTLILFEVIDKMLAGLFL